jgi:hypothetical protein
MARLGAAQEMTMNIAPDLPILRFIYWLINTPGLGGVFLGAIVITCLGGILAGLRWIVRGGQADEPITYAYPTSALLDHK